MNDIHDMIPRSAHDVSRREFLAIAATSAALAGCGAPTAPTVENARLRSRPGTPARRVGPGFHPLNLGWARDGFLYVPPTYDATVPAPLLVLLHGGGFSSTEWSSAPLAQLVDDLGIIVLGPDSRARTWDVVRSGHIAPDAAFIDSALRWTFERCRIDGTRMGLGGFSDGATYALSLGITNGDLFSTLLAFSPGAVRAAARFGSPRIFVSHGVQDPVIPVENSRAIVQALRTEGFDVRYDEFDGGHTIGVARARDAFEWFLAV